MLSACLRRLNAPDCFFYRYFLPLLCCLLQLCLMLAVFLVPGGRYPPIRACCCSNHETNIGLDMNNNAAYAICFDTGVKLAKPLVFGAVAEH